jgi:AAA domain
MGRAERLSARQKAAAAELQSQLATIYTPGTPIDESRLFSGRKELLADLSGDLTTAGVHFVLYGERGVGKTSLCQVLLEDKRVTWHSASVLDDFVTIFYRVLEELGEQFTDDQRKSLTEVAGTLGPDKIASITSKEGFETSAIPVAKRQLDLNFVLDRIKRRASDLDAIVIDEFQNISAAAVQTQIIEVVKGFSDRKLDVKIFIVGVADSDDELISSTGYPEYKGRHLRARRVPRMSDDEVRDILDIRKRLFHIGLDDEVKEGVVEIASGYPVTAHRLALMAAQNWAMRALVGYAWKAGTQFLSWFFPSVVTADRLVKSAGVQVEQQDLCAAIKRFVRDFGENHATVAAAYDKALSSERRETVERVLAALASSPTTRVGADYLVEHSDVCSTDLDQLLNASARDLVEHADPHYWLAVREMRPYVEAQRYLTKRCTAIDASPPSGP